MAKLHANLNSPQPQKCNCGRTMIFKQMQPNVCSICHDRWDNAVRREKIEELVDSVFGVELAECMYEGDDEDLRPRICRVPDLLHFRNQLIQQI